MQRAYVRLVVTLLVAGALSCVAGLLFTQIV
jgi:VIT1/CCC1 family predicted Fe2+/Mn2+ transporter